jgi:hypothetical protein
MGVSTSEDSLRLGKEKEAMRSLLWHATEALWFEYNAGSRLYYFRFPLRYQRIAQDGVPIYFEQPGPSTMQCQPEFSDPQVRERVKSKVDKVIRHKYLTTRVKTGLKL